MFGESEDGRLTKVRGKCDILAAARRDMSVTHVTFA